jgi:cell division protein FtsI (penicillin-binding protein 3)
MITDRNGEPLAISTPVESVWASPPDVRMDAGKLKQLAQSLDMSTAAITRRLSDTGREFVYLKRQLPPEQAKRAANLGIPGIFLQREYRRYYPEGAVTAQVVGLTGVDDNGQEGLELSYQKWLAGTPGSRRVIKDRLGHIIEDVESIRSPRQGHDLTLSIDSRIQYLAFRELKAAVSGHHAKDGSIVVLDVRTGEVLAMASAPSYNPNNRDHIDQRYARNRSITDEYEPGSTLKPFTIAAALQAGIVAPDTKIQTAPGTLTIDGHTIHDAERENMLTVAQVIQKSSNVGASKIALQMKPKQMWDMFHAVGFGMPPGSGFPGEASGKVRPYRTWRPIGQATMSFGNGISVSLLQLARAYLIFATDGRIKPVTLIRHDTPEKGVAVISPKVAHEVRRMLEMVVGPGGTAPRAQVVGYQVAGKTGTAHKVVGGGYSPDHYVASFIGFAPASSPRLIIAVMIDDPKGAYYGGLVAAPVFQQVMTGALRILDIPHDAPMNNIVLPPPGAVVKEDA